MASVYTNDLRLEEIGSGEQSGTWGDTTNTNLELIAEAFSFGTEAITTNADTHTTTIADGSTDPGRSIYLKYTGTLDSACTITLGPNTVSKVWFIENATSGSQNIIISQGSGANVTIGNGAVKMVYSDGAGSGAAVVDALVDLDLTGTTTIAAANISGDLDVDGTTNLDVVDIDGAVDMASTLQVDGAITSSSGATITTADNTDTLTLVSTDADANQGPVLNLFRNSSTPADSDVLGQVIFSGENDNDEEIDYARFQGFTVDVSDGTEDGGLNLQAMLAGTLRSRLKVNGTELTVNDDSQDLDFRIETNGNSEAFFVDGGNNAVITGETVAHTTISGGTPAFQVSGDGFRSGAALVRTDTSNAFGPFLALVKTRSTTPGSFSIVSDGDNCGSVSWFADDGTNLDSQVATISGEIDATPGANDTPGRLVFSTTADGAATVTEAMRIDSSQNVGLGATPLALRSDQTGLQMGGNFSIMAESSTSADNSFNLSQNAYFDGAWKYISTDEVSNYFQSAGKHNFRVAASGTAGNTISWTTAMTIDTSGSVLIGTDTDGIDGGNNLTIGDSGQGGMTIRTGTTSRGNIYFSDGTSGDSEYEGILRYDHDGDYMTFATASAHRMRIDSSGNLCVNDTTTRLPNGHTVSIAGDNSTHGLSVVRYNNSYGCYGINIGRSKNNTVGSNTALANNDTIGYVTWYGNDGTDTNSISAQIEARIDGTVAGNNVPGELVFRTSADGHGGGAGGESMIIDSSQNVGIGTAPATRLDVSNGTERHQVSFASGEVYLMARNASAYITQEYIANVHVFTGYGDSSSNEAMRIESDGDFVIGETSSTNVINGTGAYVATNGQLYASTSSTSGHFLNVQNDSQAVLNFRHAGSTEGDVSISGSTVTYNGFSGTHESSGIASNVEIGTVCSTIDELDVYPDTQPTAKGGTQEHPKKGQTRADHAKIKVADTEGDKRVYGVLQRYDNNGKPLVASVGIGSVRVTGACEGGDLLESNGDGTAKVQSDDIIRSKTIGKVTIGNSNTGVKLVSCVLYCG